MTKEQEKESIFHIVGLKVSNIKRVKAVSITPVGTTVTIGGKNDQGKSSVIDAIFYAMAGQGVVCERPIRDGASSAEVVVDLDELVITKKWKSGSAPTLRISMKDGTPVSSPQTILDKLCSKLSFDPLEFSRMKGPQQLETLRSLVGLDFTLLESERKRLYDERTLINRQLDSQKARLGTMAKHDDAPAEEVSVAKLVTDLQKAQTMNTGHGHVRAAVGILKGNIVEQKRSVELAKDAITDLKVKLAEAKSTLNVLETRHSAMLAKFEKSQAEAAALVDEDTTSIENQITAADGVNAKVRENRARKEAEGLAQKLAAESDLKTRAIEGLDAKKQQQLSEAKFPLEGLSFDDSGVLLNGVPFTQSGKGHQILASCAIARALNPRLRVILIRDGNLMDDETRALVEKDAEATGHQVWVEVVTNNKDDEAKCTVVLEDGNLKEVE